MKRAQVFLFLFCFGIQTYSQISIHQISQYSGLSEQDPAGMYISNGFLYISGYDASIYNGQSLLLKYSVNDISTPLWRIIWPNVPGYTGSPPNAEVFRGVAADGNGIYAAGDSWSQTIDYMGGKESKSVLCKFPLDGATGSNTGGAGRIAKPNFFPSYQGIESFLDVTISTEQENDFIYACGYAQSGGLNNTAVLTKYDSRNNLIWTKISGNVASEYSSYPNSINILNDNIYIAGYTVSPNSDPHITMWKYDPSGNLVWEKSTETTVYSLSNAICSSGQYFYVAGIVQIPDNGLDVIIFKCDENGNILWAVAWGGSSDDIANGIEVIDNKLIVVGETSSFGSGGKDAFVLELNADDGSVIDNKFYGGIQDDAAIKIRKNNNIAFITGTFQGDAAFDEITLHSSGDKDIFILKLNSLPRVFKK